MSFPNTQKGINKLIIASIIIIVGSVIVEIFSFAREMSKLVVNNPNGNAANNAANNMASASQNVNPDGLRSLFILIILGSIVMIVGIVFQILGLWQSGKDEVFFKYAMYAVVINFFGVFFIRLIPDSQNHMMDYVYCGTTMVTLVYSILIIQGTINIAKKVDDSLVEKKGRFMYELMIVVYFLMFVLRVVGVVVRDKAAKDIQTVIEVGVVLTSVIAFFLLLSVLLNTKKMLAEQNG